METKPYILFRVYYILSPSAPANVVPPPTVLPPVSERMSPFLPGDKMRDLLLLIYLGVVRRTKHIEQRHDVIAQYCRGASHCSTTDQCCSTSSIILYGCLCSTNYLDRLDESPSPHTQRLCNIAAMKTTLYIIFLI